MIKAGHNGGILAGIMHTEIENMLMWQRIKEERGVRVTSVHACMQCDNALGNTFFVKNYKNYSTASILLRVGQIFESGPLN